MMTLHDSHAEIAVAPIVIYGILRLVGTADRAAEAEQEWCDAAQEALEAHPDYEDGAEVINAALAKVRAAVAEYDQAREEALHFLHDVTLPPVEPVEPEDNSGDADDDQIVFDGKASFVAATRRLKHEKRYYQA